MVLFFGYAQCPDVCPTTMTEMAQVKQQLGKDGDKLQVLFVTVDPARDTPEVMKAYMGAFDPAFVALIPTPDQLAALAKDFKVYYKKVDGKTPTSYSMDHSAASYVYDTQGRLRLYARYGAGVAPMVAGRQGAARSPERAERRASRDRVDGNESTPRARGRAPDRLQKARAAEALRRTRPAPSSSSSSPPTSIWRMRSALTP